MKTKTPKKTNTEIVTAMNLLHDAYGINPRRATDEELAITKLRRKDVTEESLLAWGKANVEYRTTIGNVVPTPNRKPSITVNTTTSPVNVGCGANGTRTVSKLTPQPITPPRAGNAVVTAPGFKAHRAKFTICGHGVSSILRWMGFNYWTPSEARHILNQYAETREVAEATINAQTRDGRNQADGKKMSHGPVPELTDAQIEELYSKRPKGKVCHRSTPASPASTASSTPARTSTKTHPTEKPSKKKGFKIPSRPAPTAGKPAKKKVKSRR